MSLLYKNKTVPTLPDMELLEKTFPTLLDTKNALIRCKNIVIQGSKKDRITYFKISVTVKLRTE